MKGGTVITMGVPVCLTDILSVEPAAEDQAQLHQIQQTIDGSCSSLFTKLVEDGFVSEQRLLELLSGKLGIATGNSEKVQELSLIGINTRLTNSI